MKNIHLKGTQNAKNHTLEFLSVGILQYIQSAQGILPSQGWQKYTEMESEVYTETTANSIMNEKHYNRYVRAHKLTD